MYAPPALNKDFYKSGHPFQYPEGTEEGYSNFTARSTKHANFGRDFDGKIVVYGIQGMIKEILIEQWDKGFFNRPKAEVIGEYKRIMDNCLGPGAVPTDKLEALHDLGYLPIRIKALPEGSRVNVKVPLFTSRSTVKGFGWVVNMLETVMSAELWPMVTVATIAYQFRQQTNRYANQTGANKDFTAWQNHDFSMRGMFGSSAACAGSSGHLLSSYGTDSIPAILYLEKYYGADVTKGIVGGSVAATEHAVMCAGGKADERETVRRLVQDIYPSGIVSIVSDTWDFWNTITNIASSLKEEILGRQENALGQAKVVFRPDSGDPADVLCGVKVHEHPWWDGLPLEQVKPIVVNTIFNAAVGKGVCELFGRTWEVSGYLRHAGLTYKITAFGGFYYDENGQMVFDIEDTEDVTCERHDLTPQEKGAVQCLWEEFGGTLNSKGYRELNPRVGLIYGDSITLEVQQDIFYRLWEKGYSSGNVVFGIGSYTYQYNTRDTLGMAMKATYAVVDGVGRELFKDPVTDSGGVKKSAKGLLRVDLVDGEYVLSDQQTDEQEAGGELQTVFENGVLVREQTLDEIRARLWPSNA